MRHAHIPMCMQSRFAEDTREPRRRGFWRHGVWGKGSFVLPERRSERTRSVSPLNRPPPEESPRPAAAKPGWPFFANHSTPPLAEVARTGSLKPLPPAAPPLVRAGRRDPTFPREKSRGVVLCGDLTICESSRPRALASVARLSGRLRPLTAPTPRQGPNGTMPRPSRDGSVRAGRPPSRLQATPTPQ